MCLGLAPLNAADRGDRSKTTSKHRISSEESHTDKSLKKRSSKSSRVRSNSSARRTSKASSRAREHSRSNKNRVAIQDPQIPIPSDANVQIDMPTREFETAADIVFDDDQSGILFGTTPENVDDIERKLDEQEKF